jgi:hypothetical protein
MNMNFLWVWVVIQRPERSLGRADELWANGVECREGKFAALTDIGFRMLQGALNRNNLGFGGIFDQGHKLRWYFWVTNRKHEVLGKGWWYFWSKTDDLHGHEVTY